MSITKLNGKQYTVRVDGEKLVLTPVVEKAKGLITPTGSAWYVGCEGDAYCERATNDAMKFGNCFPSKTVAIRAAELMRRSNIFISAALQADSDAGEWAKDRQWTACKNVHNTSNEVGTFECENTSELPAFVHTEAQAEEMARILTAEGWK